jgi:hypothetical protein
MFDNLMKFFAYAGYPKVIISDTATNFVSKLNRLLYQKLGIELKTSTPFHSKGNSTIKRYWGTFRSLLTHVVTGSKPREWHKASTFLLCAYRGMVNETTGVSPYMLVHGHEPRTVLDILFDVWTGQDVLYAPVLNKSETAYLEQLRESIRVAQGSACTAQARHEQEYVSRYNLRARMKEFRVGDKVLILLPDSTSKVKARWIGPGEVVERRSPHIGDIFLFSAS